VVSTFAGNALESACLPEKVGKPAFRIEINRWLADRRERAQAREHLRDPQGHLRGACGLAAGSDPGWALVRPDGYLAASGNAIDGQLIQAVGLALGLTGVHA